LSRKVGAHRFAEGREKGLFAKEREDPETFQLVLDRILHLRKTHLDAGGA
jgi:hypothetical protein